MTFLQKSNSDYHKFENPILVTTSYEGSNDEKELKMVPIITHNNNNSNVVCDIDDKNQERFLMKI